MQSTEPTSGGFNKELDAISVHTKFTTDKFYPDNTMREVLLLSPFYRCENGGTGRLSNLPTST